MFLICFIVYQRCINNLSNYDKLTNGKTEKRFVHHVNQTLHNICNKDSQMKEQRMDGEWWMVKTLTMHGNVRCYESKTREICLCNVHISNLMRIGGHTLCSIIWALLFVEDRGYQKRQMEGSLWFIKSMIHRISYLEAVKL